MYNNWDMYSLVMNQLKMSFTHPDICIVFSLTTASLVNHSSLLYLPQMYNPTGVKSLNIWICHWTVTQLKLFSLVQFTVSSWTRTPDYFAHLKSARGVQCSLVPVSFALFRKMTQYCPLLLRRPQPIKQNSIILQRLISAWRHWISFVVQCGQNLPHSHRFWTSAGFVSEVTLKIC